MNYKRGLSFEEKIPNGIPNFGSLCATVPRNYLPLSYENMNKLSKATTTNTEPTLHPLK